MRGLQLLGVPAEIHLGMFRGLGQAGCDLDDVFRLASTCKTLYNIYKANRMTITSHLIAKSPVYSYDVLTLRLIDLDEDRKKRTDDWLDENDIERAIEYVPKVVPEAPTVTEKDVAGCCTSLYPTPEEARMIARQWQLSEQGKEYRRQINDYKYSPFPYKWHYGSMTSIGCIGEYSDGDISSEAGNSILSTSFKYQFHRAHSRSELAFRLFHLAENASSGSDRNKIRDWAYKTWDGDRASSFLEFLQVLEVYDFAFGYQIWRNCLPDEGEVSTEMSCDVRSCLHSLQINRHRDMIALPDFFGHKLEDFPASFGRFLSTKDLTEEGRKALMQAWFSFRKNWPQTGRVSVWSLQSSEDAYAKIRDWMEAGARRATSL